MIFPYFDTFDRELFWGAMARLSGRMSFGDLKTFQEKAFGSRTVIAVPDLPAHLRAFEAALTPDSYSADDLLNQHTLYPIYACFLGEKRAATLRSDLLGAKGGRAHVSTGINASRVEQPLYFRICPACSREQQDQRQTTWWVRNHQLAGVTVCALHGAKLIDTRVLMRHRRTRHNYVLPPTHEERVIEKARPEEVIIAEIADEIFSQRPVFDPVKLNLLFRRKLDEKGYLTNGGNIRWKLADDLAAYYGEGHLALIESPTRPEKRIWLSELLRRPCQAHAPVQYLSLMGFLGLRVADYAEALTVKAPAKKVPQRTDGWQKHDAIIARLWLDNDVSLRAIARAVEADPMTVKRRAVVLGLPFPRQGKRPTRVLPPAVKPREPKGELARRRAAWSELRTAHPDFTRKELRKADPATFSWLYRYDKTWLYVNQPPATPHLVRSRQVVDWHKRDLHLSGEVKRVAAELRESDIEGRITAHEIARNLFYQGSIRIYSAKLPRTTVALASESETRIEYALRRIKRDGGNLRLRPALRELVDEAIRTGHA